MSRMTLNQILTYNHISKYRLSKNSGVPYMTINDICSGKRLIWQSAMPRRSIALQRNCACQWRSCWSPIFKRALHSICLKAIFAISWKKWAIFRFWLIRWRATTSAPTTNVNGIPNVCICSLWSITSAEKTISQFVRITTTCAVWNCRRWFIQTVWSLPLLFPVMNPSSNRQKTTPSLNLCGLIS